MPKYQIVPSTKFRKDLKRFQVKSKEYNAIIGAVNLLSDGGHENIHPGMKPHRLKGDFQGYWECHLLPDLLLIWESESPAEIYLVRVGSHADLF
jgi:mRNA interferase YafQ